MTFSESKEFQVHSSSLKEIRVFAREVLSKDEIFKSTKDDVVLALAEAAQNIVKHAYNGAATSDNLKICLEIFDNLLMTPDCLHIKNAPQKMKDNIEHFDYWMNYPSSIEKQNEFRRWIGVLDKHRGCNIKDYLPEVAGYYGIS